MLQALARDLGATCERLPARADDAAEIGAAVMGAVATSELVLVIAGSSRGRADHTASVLERHGELVAHGVALRPAHPVALGVVEGTPVIGIPGYPVAAAVAFERFGRPLLELLLGALPEDAPLIRVRLAGEVRARRGVEAYVPLILSAGDDLPLAMPQSRKGGALRGLAGAHALLCARLEDGVLPAGSEVDARLLRPWPRSPG
jgi:putative molybdopterin biosynthesis protein